MSGISHSDLISRLIGLTREGVYPEGVKIPEAESMQAKASDALPAIKLAGFGEKPSLTTTHRFIPWGQQIKQDFLASVLWIESTLGLNASYLIPCMKFESNLNPQARNHGSSATGLIQFMEATAKRLGTTTVALFGMTAVEQLNYVYKYFLDYQKRGYNLSAWTLEDTYMAILWPAGIGKELDYRVFVAHSEAYKVNSGLDLDHDGTVTKREATARVRKLFDDGMLPANRLVI